MDIDLEEDYVSWPTVYKSKNEPVAQQNVTYRDVGVQSLPDSNADAFQTIYNREPKQDELVSKVLTEAIDRYTSGVGSGPYEIIVGEPFPAPMSVETGETYEDASFQALRDTDCKISIVRAKAKASILVAQQRPVAQAVGYKIWCEKRDDLIIHTAQCPIRIRINEDGYVTDTDAHAVMLPNICGEEIDSTAASLEIESAQVWSRTLPYSRFHAEASTYLNRIPFLAPGSPMEICQPWVPEQFVATADTNESKMSPVSKRDRWDKFPTPTLPPPKPRVAPERIAAARRLASRQHMHQDLTGAQHTTDAMDIDPTYGASDYTYNRSRPTSPPPQNLSPGRTSAPHSPAPRQTRDNLTKAPANPDTSFADYVTSIRRNKLDQLDQPAYEVSAPLNYDEEGSAAWWEAQDVDVYATSRAVEDARREAVAEERDAFYGVNCEEGGMEE
ncbi:hypothetical protein COCVIDRAFT_27342 [Bipolaris victoriae FI3]|uniref:Uncharacterized protein n=1 Tax=Bipolaris victoriae (strain FI3) TaxID=930091 RepID=W7EH62_BIPV3|nr:hypothetical protein COCVIDRAFT_27342 [Bipolaris victoriae FI3]